ncbi:MAG: TetR family transcriptional regulator, partial [Propionibacteriaceae bacterium]|nr:TetR family transcriptional regulator [Propionibacteriaceae bacterium]
MNLSQDQIVATACTILNTYGLADVSMRRIAANLGVQPSALYWHFASKQALLDAIAAVILADLPAFSGGDLTRVRLWAARFHALLSKYRDGAELVWSALTCKDWQAGIGYQLEQGLIEAGVSPQRAHGAATGILNLVLGQAFDDDQRRQAARLGVNPTPVGAPTADTLDDAVGLLVAGLAA